MKVTLIIDREVQHLILGVDVLGYLEQVTLTKIFTKWAETADVNFERDGGFGIPFQNEGSIHWRVDLNLCVQDLKMIKECNLTDEELFLDMSYLLELTQAELDGEFKDIEV